MVKLLAAIVFGFVVSSIYRPYQNRHDFFDFHLADSGPGFFVLIAFYYVMGLSDSKESYKHYNLPFLVFLLYLIQELLSLLFPNLIGHYDTWDILYYLLAYVFLYLFEPQSLNPSPVPIDLKFGENKIKPT